MHTPDPGHAPPPLLAKLEQSIVLTQAEQAAVENLPYVLETVLAGEGSSWTGDRSQRSFTVLKGMLATSKTMWDGELQITALHIPGDMPDLLSLHLEVLDCDIGALTDCELAFMAHADLWRLCEENPRLSAVLWRTTLVEGAISREWVVNLGQRAALGRIAHLFCEMMSRMDAVGLVQDKSCHLGLTQGDLRQATGLSAVHVNRTLQALRTRKLISFGQGTLAIHNWEALVRVADFRIDYLHLPATKTA